MDLLTKTLLDIETRLSRIEEQIDLILPQTQKMAEHVDKVEHVAHNTPLVSKLLNWDNRPKRVLTNQQEGSDSATWPSALTGRSARFLTHLGRTSDVSESEPRLDTQTRRTDTERTHG